MDIRKAELERLKSMTQDWIDHPEQELEASFGADGQVNATTFAAIGKRLKNRGYTAVTQEDRLNIITPKHVRIQLSGLGVIQSYCRDDRLAGRKFAAMIKDRTSKNANIDLEDYDVRVKTRREVTINDGDADMAELLDQWAVQQKAFRLLRRWTFRGDGIRFDLSMVRQTKRDARGEYRWVNKFTQQDLSKELPVYEVEVELDRVEGDTVDTALPRLIKGIGEILRGIQKSPILIRNSVKRKVLQGYQALTRLDKFRGASTMTLELANMILLSEPGVPNIRQGYNVTDKADGLRSMGYVTEAGNLYLIDNAMNVYETGLQVEACANSLVDGEWITKNTAHEAIHQYLLFDIYYAPGGKDVSKLPFYDEKGGVEQRYAEMRQWEKSWNTEPGPKEVIKGLTPKTKLMVSAKKFGFAKVGDASIFQAAARVLDTPRIYETDGLIFTKNDVPLPEGAMPSLKQQFKWKPSKDNTIDFMVVTEKIPKTTVDQVYNGVHPTSGKEIRYKSLRLHVGSRDDPSKNNPRDVVLNNLPLPGARSGPREYRPVLFQPKDFADPDANACYVEVEKDLETGEEYAYCEGSKEPIVDKSIVEISYDPSRPPGWRWVPKLVRSDKTEKLLRGELSRTLNADGTAQSIWNSIHEPITLSMIRTGAEEPSLSEITAISSIEKDRAAITGKYKDRKAPEKDTARVRPLRDFHNRYIKETILYSSIMKKPGLGLIDIGVGQAPDIQKWRRMNAGAVLGIDIAGDSITSPYRSAYKSLMDTIAQNGRDRVLPMAFVIGDGSKNMATGQAGASALDSTILQSVLGKVRPSGAVPPYIQEELVGRFARGADVMSCMFATHYFFASKDSFDGFLKNIAENLKVGGYFCGCCFDGEKTFEFLRGRDSRVGEEDGMTFWSITKKYDADEIPLGDEAFGMGIDVNFISIGQEHREFLVPFGLLTEKLRTIGLELCNATELKELGLQHSTAMFEESHKMAKASGRQFPMTAAVREFSFLNRWFIFRRRGDLGVVAPAAIPAAIPNAPRGVANAVARPNVEATDENRDELVADEVQAGIAVGNAPVAAATAASGKRVYAPAEVIQFSQDATASLDRLKIGDKSALRWISPGSPFPIQDPADPAEPPYPSIEHFLAAMRYKVATDKPGLAQSLFGQQGSIHQKFLRERATETGVGAGAKALTEDRDAKLLVEELKSVHEEMRVTAMKRYKAKFNEASWDSLKDGLLKEAVRQRWEKDARYRTIVEAAKQQGKTLLFYTGSATSEYGGKRTQEGVLEGQNKLGKVMMEVAGF